MSFEAVTVETDRFLDWENRITPGTGTGLAYGAPPELLPELWPGLPLYDVTLAWITKTWGGYNKMPTQGRRAWYLLLGVSRGRPGNKENILKRWVQWLESDPGRTETAETPPGENDPTKTSDALATSTPATTTAHSDDFTSVCWFGTSYQFSKGQQADAVSVLWKAWENKTPSLSEQTIREKIRSSNDHFRLEHVFKPRNKSGRRQAHPAWGTMIKSVRKGTFALSAPESQV